MVDLTNCVALFLLVFVPFCVTTPVPDTAPCSLTVWNRATFDNVTKTKLNVREGATVSLSCEYRCPGAEKGKPPEIEWLGPGYTRIRSTKGRIFVDPGETPRIKLLYVHSISADNIGLYTCHARGGPSVHAELDMEVQAKEFTNLDLTRGEDRPSDEDRFLP
ncbi:uncharacterized protein LOC117344853 [Pecten maximus]|uniref:uncharacterized protein LOC117344853 n=1 Tax=Pecten maximus TaxID=6579 RepID=UPI001458A879|nr:uncharacterized protein LOC117344853 [Pecten maximus]